MCKEEINNIEIIPLIETLRLLDGVCEKRNDYISNSRLSLINPEQDNDPDAFFEGLSKHPKYSESMLVGSAIHAKVLQPLLFNLVELDCRPTAKLGFMADELYKIYKDRKITDDDFISVSDKVDYFKGKMSIPRIEYIKKYCEQYWKERKRYDESNDFGSKPIYLNTKMINKVYSCVDSIHGNSYMKNLLTPKGVIQDPECGNEQTVLLDVEMRVPDKEPFVFKLKAIVDNYSIDFETGRVTINDLKTTSKPTECFDDSFEKFHYSRELAMYSWLISLVAKHKYNMEQFKSSSNCLVVSTTPCYDTRIYNITREQLSKGWDEFKFLLKLAAWHYSNGYKFS